MFMLPRRFRAAFTLVELTISMAIIAVLCAIAMPRYARAIASYRARAAAQRIANDLLQVQSYARTSSTSQKITFNVSSANYQIANLRDLESSATTYRVSLTDEPYRSTIGTANFGGGQQINFNGYGYPDVGGSITVQSGNTSRTVLIDAQTGKVTVQ